MFNKQMNFVDAGNVTQAFDKETGMDENKKPLEDEAPAAERRGK